MIYVVIPVHNRKQYTRKCLACLRDQTEQAHQVVVVDDGSTDGTADMIQAEFPNVLVRMGTGSLWWAGGTNLGIQYVLDHLKSQPNDFLLTLNDDTEIAPNYLANLLNAYSAKQPCIIGSVSVDIREPGRLLYAGTHIDMSFAKIRDLAKTRFKQQQALLATGPHYIPSDCLPGRGMLIPISVFSKIGLLDELHFQHHMADLDFSIRARKAGFSLFVATNCVVYEHAEATGLALNKSTSIRQFLRALFTTRSPINLKTRYHFARIHAPAFLIYLTFDLARIFGGYVRRKLMND
ncbi:glycosyltransferase family 2 protein [Spirosoma sp. KCTC 42546]|uniref:glycosyltransferase family 2 protein n=1 Tax=Spirosoma sp. KCTC 42546 TaxID=2520506 RepID=UPI00115B5D04|nr:glycosyltransferase family 2 protein [Spirosoma sp. KCTC 42546]QDK83750.1 glycosyltransferase family 2 protein [Spirosoma sp. KCTC 42546]